MFYMIGEFGCKPTVKMYNLFLDALLSENKFEMVSSAYKNMKEDHMEPNVYTYNTLLKAMCKNNRVDAAQKLLLQMSSKGCDLDVIIYTTVVSCMCNIDKMDEAKDLATRFQPSMPTYNALIKGFTKNHRIPELIEKMIVSRVKPDAITYNTTTDAYSRKGQVETVIQLKDRLSCGGLVYRHSCLQ
ncbi:Pentatricopeptide repeat-containing protein At3g48810 [Linum perenne]